MHLLAWTWLDFWTNLLQVFLMLLGMFLILVVLLQRGRGGGLAGAFGGAGGQSAFGTKAGDVFTRITIGIAILWVVMSGVSGMLIRRTQSAISDTLPEGEDPPPSVSADGENDLDDILNDIDLSGHGVDAPSGDEDEDVIPENGEGDDGIGDTEDEADDNEAADNDPDGDAADDVPADDENNDEPSNGEGTDDATATDPPMEEESGTATQDDSVPSDEATEESGEAPVDGDEAAGAGEEESEEAPSDDAASTSDEPADPPN